LIDDGNSGIVGVNLVQNKDALDGVDLGLDAPWKNAAKEKKKPNRQASESLAVHSFTKSSLDIVNPNTTLLSEYAGSLTNTILRISFPMLGD